MDYLDTKFPITAVAISEAGNELFSGGIDNDIKVSSSFMYLILFFFFYKAPTDPLDRLGTSENAPLHILCAAMLIP